MVSSADLRVKERVQEREFSAFSEMYRQEMERELVERGADIFLRGLVGYYDLTYSLEDHFYPMGWRLPEEVPHREEELGLVLPFRRLIFHSLNPQNVNEDVRHTREVLKQFSARRHYDLKYNKFAGENNCLIIAALLGDKLLSD